MEHAVLNNKVLMPMVGFGTWNLRGDDCIRAVETAASCGYRLFDTAIMYENEAEVGCGIKNAGIPRENVFITTKLDSSCNGYEQAKAGICRSLERMGAEYIDLFLVHEPYDRSPEMYRALCEAYESGLVRAVGVSNFNRRRLDSFLTECGIVPAVDQIESHVFYPQTELVAYLKERGITPQAWTPLAQGKNSLFSNPVLKKLREKYGKTEAQIALRFLTQLGVAVAPKSSHESRMRENLDIFDFTLRAEDMAAILRLDEGKTLSPWTEHWA